MIGSFAIAATGIDWIVELPFSHRHDEQSKRTTFGDSRVCHVIVHIQAWCVHTALEITLHCKVTRCYFPVRFYRLTALSEG
jgi:hypothetical protein